MLLYAKSDDQVVTRVNLPSASAALVATQAHLYNTVDFKRAKLFLNLPLLKCVNIVDTPGALDNDTAKQIIDEHVIIRMSLCSWCVPILQ